jgi:hypothetical protein
MQDLDHLLDDVENPLNDAPARTFRVHDISLAGTAEWPARRSGQLAQTVRVGHSSGEAVIRAVHSLAVRPPLGPERTTFVTIPGRIHVHTQHWPACSYRCRDSGSVQTIGDTGKLRRLRHGQYSRAYPHPVSHGARYRPRSGWFHPFRYDDG